MPGEDGYSLIRKLRALPSEPRAAASPPSPSPPLLAGFDRHVAKPIEPADLLVTLANLCGRLPFA
jgi:CheY-like chemotaxis protein